MDQKRQTGEERRRRSASAGQVPPRVAEYKRILQKALEIRPSGLKQKLAEALGRNPSFVSQIINPAYAVPIPAPHIETIFTVCHLSAEDRAAFLHAYARAHPRKLGELPGLGDREGRRLVLTVPDLGSPEANARFDSAIEDFVHKLGPLMRSAG